jgi:hypothetical protein
MEPKHCQRQPRTYSKRTRPVTSPTSCAWRVSLDSWYTHYQQTHFRNPSKPLSASRITELSLHNEFGHVVLIDTVARQDQRLRRILNVRLDCTIRHPATHARHDRLELLNITIQHLAEQGFAL